MERRYSDYIGESYAAMEKTNFYDAIYSPVILILNALVTAIILTLAATGNPAIQSFFGMSVGMAAAMIPDAAKRRLFGYVEQTFRPVAGTMADQISLFDKAITQDMVEAAAKLVGIHETIAALPKGYQTAYASSLLSQGQQQLLSIARAVVAQPEILLLDEITANLDDDTEQTVLTALQNASQNRTVLSISHRLYERTGGRQVQI